MGQYGSHSCRRGGAGAVARKTSASAAEQAMISPLTGRKIGQVERVDKTCFGDEASRQARALDQLEPMRLDELDDSSLDVDDDRRGHGRIIALTAPATCRSRAANMPQTSPEAHFAA